MLETKAGGGGGGGGGGNLVVPGISDQKCDQTSEINYRKFCRNSNTRNLNQEFYWLVALKMVSFGPKRNATYISRIPFPTLFSFFTLNPRVCTGGGRLGVC